MPPSFTVVFYCTTPQHASLHFYFLFLFIIYLSCHLFIYRIHSLNLLPIPPLKYAVKDTADGLTNPRLFFLLIQHMAGMDNVSNIINIEVKRGVK